MARGYSAVGLCYPKTPANVGGVLRAAGCYGAAMVAMQGQRFSRSPTDVRKEWRHMPLLEVADLRHCIPYDCVPIAIELKDGAKSLPTYSHPERAFYIFGPEDGSIANSVLAWCRDVVQVPTRYCMNLAATVNVVLYDRMTKSKAA